MRIPAYFLVSLACMVIPQAVRAQTVKLVPSSTTVVQTEWHRPLHLPLRCDGDGNIYLRGFEQGNPASPVLRLSPKGDRVTTFSIGNEASLQKGVVQDFAVSLDGEVFELVQCDSDVYIASFSDDGSFKSKTKIERQFWAIHLNVLAGGTSFLITGSDLPVRGGPPPKLMNAIFDSSGRLVKEISFQHDPAELKEAAKGKPKVENYLGDKTILPLVTGDAQTGADGNLYVMRASKPAVIFALDSTGKLVRTVTVEPPESGMDVGSMKFSANWIAVLFYRANSDGQVEKRILALVDPRTGVREHTYVLGEGLGGAFACSNGTSYDFVTDEGGKLAITYAQPE